MCLARVAVACLPERWVFAWPPAGNVAVPGDHPEALGFQVWGGAAPQNQERGFRNGSALVIVRSTPPLPSLMLQKTARKKFTHTPRLGGQCGEARTPVPGTHTCQDAPRLSHLFLFSFPLLDYFKANPRHPVILAFLYFGMRPPPLPPHLPSSDHGLARGLRRALPSVQLCGGLHQGWTPTAGPSWQPVPRVALG